MSDELNALKEQLAALMARQTAPAAPSGAGWAAPAVSTLPGIIGVSVPVKIQTSTGSVKVQLHLPPEYADPARLLPAIEAMIQQGIPVDGWRPSGNSGWGSRKGGW